MEIHATYQTVVCEPLHHFGPETNLESLNEFLGHNYMSACQDIII